MARLRLASVELKVCPTKDCGIEYEGSQCPKCKQPFDPKIGKKVMYDRLILVDVDPPVYKQKERLRCKNKQEHYRRLTGHSPSGKLGDDWDNLYDIPADWGGWENVREAKELLKRSQRLQEVAESQEIDEETLRQKIQERLSTLCCPLCGKGAPQRPTTVWVRTFHIQESLEELQQRELLKSAGNEVEEEVGEIETEEVNHNVEEYGE